jgi:hypothetical protein
MKVLSVDELRAAGRTVEAPFRLEARVAESGESLVVRRVLRLLPGKRLTAEAQWRGQLVVLKLFFAGRGAARHFRRERDGLAALRAAGVATPELLAAGVAEGAPLLILEFLADARPLSRIPKATMPRDAILSTLRRLHAAGLRQNDIHPDNFLVASNVVHCIDGDGVDARQAGHPLPERLARDNLALFLAQFTPEESLQWLDDAPELFSRESLLAAVRRQRVARFGHYRRKLYRDCTEIIREQNARSLLLLRREEDSPALRALLADLDGAIARGQPLKTGRSATVARCELAGGHSVVIKRYNVPATPWRAIGRAIRPSRAWRSWGNAHLLRFFALPASKPLAMLERRCGPLRGTAYFLSEYVEGQQGLAYFEQHPEPPAAVLDALTRLFTTLWEQRVTLGDAKLSNFLLCDDAPHAWLIDLDDIRLHRSERPFARAWARDRARLLRNWDPQPRWRAWFEARLP